MFATDTRRQMAFMDPASTLILIVDDNQFIRELVQDALSMQGITVLSAETGRAGVGIYKYHRREISLVLLDINMPDTDGFTVLRQLRQIKPDVKVVFSSSDSVPADEMRGVTGYLPKPYSYQELVDIVNDVLAT